MEKVTASEEVITVKLGQKYHIQRPGLQHIIATVHLNDFGTIVFRPIKMDQKGPGRRKASALTLESGKTIKLKKPGGICAIATIHLNDKGGVEFQPTGDEKRSRLEGDLCLVS